MTYSMDLWKYLFKKNRKWDIRKPSKIHAILSNFHVFFPNFDNIFVNYPYN